MKNETKIKSNCSECICKSCINACADECYKCSKHGGYVGFCNGYTKIEQLRLEGVRYGSNTDYI